MPKSLENVALLCGALLAAVATNSLAQQIDAADETLDEIVVVAHKHARAVSDIAGSVTVLTQEDINDTLSNSFSDVLRYTPGVDYVSSGTRFGNEGINIRGIGGNRVATLVDGVPLSDQFDVGSFSNATRDFLNAGLVERAEVLRGPASALYGSSAIGGVVAVRTPDPARFLEQQTVGGDLMATYQGADGSLHGTGMIAFGSADTGLLFGGSIREGEQFDSAAIDEVLDLRNYTRRSALVKFVANDRLDNTWRIGFIHQDSDVQSELNSMLGAGRFRRTTALEGDDQYEMDLLNVSYEFGGSEGWIDAGVIRGYYEIANVQQSTLDERGLATRPVSIDRYFEFDQNIQGAEINLQKSLSGRSVEHQLGFGVEYRQRQTEEYRDALETGIDDGLETNILLGEVFPLRDFPISHSSEWGAYIEDVMSVGDWSIIAAVRADSYSLDPKNDPMYEEDFPFAEPVSLSESDISPKLGLIYHFSPDVEVYAQYSHGFRAPPYEDANIGLDIPLFNYRAIPNPDLRSESSDGIDLGMRWRGSESDFQFAVFRTRYDDFIASKMRIGTDPVSGRILFQSQNLKETVIQGFEGNWNVGFLGAMDNVSFDGSFYLARGENKDTGEPLNSVGPAQLTSGLRWSSEDGARSARLQGTFTEAWSRLDESTGELFKPAGNAVFDFYFSQKIGERTTARFGLLNLTDKTYWRWTDVRGLSPDDPTIPYLAQSGRSISFSLNMRWQ
jgi:hemoglobin/transferrin/lactoferrin receptor protein